MAQSIKAEIRLPWDGLPLFTFPVDTREFARAQLADQLDNLAGQYPDGFVVRVGERYTEDLVRLWGNALDRHPGLHLFGTADHDPQSFIGTWLEVLNRLHPDRCRLNLAPKGSPCLKPE